MNSVLDVIPCVTMGLGCIDEQLEGYVNAIREIDMGGVTGVITSYAKLIGCCLALGVGANECYQMILGRKGLDVMKLVHIVIISFCITFSNAIVTMADQPGKLLEDHAKAIMLSKNENITKLEDDVAKAQENYIKHVRDKMAQLYVEGKHDYEWYQMGELYDDVLEKVKMWATNILLTVETTLSQWLSIIIRFVAQVLMQVIYYGIIVSQKIFMKILAAFCPLMFAISLSPHFKSAWSQWLSKYISISLWSFVAYIIMFFVFGIIVYNLTQDIKSYDELITKFDNDPDKLNALAAVGLQCLGSNINYIVGALIGVKCLSMVPEVASWLIPGGVSSGAGSAAAGVASMAGGMAGGAAGAVAAFGAQAAGGNSNYSQSFSSGLRQTAMNRARPLIGGTAGKIINRGADNFLKKYDYADNKKSKN